MLRENLFMMDLDKEAVSDKHIFIPGSMKTHPPLPSSPLYLRRVYASFPGPCVVLCQPVT
jgi:hypothetical protein